MSEVAVPRALLAVGVLLIAGIALGGVYYYYRSAQSSLNAQTIQGIAGSLSEATGSGESQTSPITFKGGSVAVRYENHTLSIYYNLSASLGSLPGIGELRPVIYEASVEFPVLVITTGGEVEPYNDTGPVLAVAPEAEGLSGVDPLVYAFTNTTSIMIVPRLVILYSVDNTSKNVSITIVVPKINVSCSTGSCSNLQGKYSISVQAKIVDILPVPYQPYNPVAEGRDIEASFNASGPTVLPSSMFGKAPITRVGLDYNVLIDIKYLYYDIYLERVG